MRILSALLFRPVVGLSMVSATVIAHPAELQLSERQLEIVRTVQAADGYIDEKMHREFWAAMPLAMRLPDARKYLNDLFESVSESRQDFVRESWLSARASLNANRIVRTRGYIDAKANALAASDNAQYHAKLRQSFASAERLLAAAASGAPLEIRGNKTFITADLISHVLASIEASEFRVAKLINPTWENVVAKYDYPEAHISILASEPFVLEKVKLRNTAGASSEMVTLTQSRGNTAQLAISFSQTAGKLIDPSKSVASVAQSALEGAGAVGREPAVVEWQGRTSATATGNAVTSDGVAFMSVRVVEVEESKGVLQFTAVSTVSAADAIYLRANLEDSIIIQPR